VSICDCINTGIAPFVGFDDIRFRIMRDSGAQGQIPDWSIVPVINAKHVPASNTSVTQYMGMGLANVTWRLRFDCRHQYYAFIAKLATSGTLRVLYGMQSHAGTQVTKLDRVYEELPNTLLIGLANAATFIGGRVEVQATFQRAFDPVTRLEVV
jgi:hypothetical protein